MRVGILTHYYRSCNYGGNLQAWALCRAIHELGYEAKQVQYDRRLDTPFWRPGWQKKIAVVKRRLVSVYYKVKKSFSNQKNNDNFCIRKESILKFNAQCIPHSEKVYTIKDLHLACSEFDAFITGSDQVWHPAAVCDAYLLNFADGKCIPKFSYAASIANDALTDIQFRRYKSSLRDFQGISVREEKAQSLLKDATELEIYTVLDPTLILSRDCWEELAERDPIEEEYLFCYFLGDDTKMRALAEEYAAKNSLKIVTLPNLNGKERPCDEKFGDYQMYDVSPGKWISLIKNAKYIFTDSFHAVAFSLIFEKQFAVFQRVGYAAMSVRITSLLDLFDAQMRFCDSEEKQCLEYIYFIGEMNYHIPFVKYEKAKESSMCFLREQLSFAEHRLTNQNE